MSGDDLDIVLSWRNHPNVRSNMLTTHEISIAEHRAWFERSLKDSTRALLVIEEAGQPIGCVVFSNVGFKTTADWSFYVDPQSASGTGKKVCAAALDVAFHYLKVHKVAGKVLDFNEASIRTHLRLGFTQERVLSDQVLINDERHDLLIFGLLSEEWSDQNAKLS